MTREQKYAEQMKALGIYHPAFDPAIHTLSIMERELQRNMKELKKAELYDDIKAASTLRAEIAQERRDILATRDALGLTPKALRRLKGFIADPDRSDDQPTVLTMLRAKHEKNA